MLKSSLRHLDNSGTQSFQEFRILLHWAANMINNRPLGVDPDWGEGKLVPITPIGVLQPHNHQDMEEDFTKYKYPGASTLPAWDS